MADTAPLPVVGPGAAPGRTARRSGRLPSRTTAPGRPVRALETVAGLLSGGVLVVGLILLLSALFAPSLLDGTGDAAAGGPGWWRVAAHLAVGIAGEAGALLRRRLPVPARVCVAVATIAACLSVLAAAWWF